MRKQSFFYFLLRFFYFNAHSLISSRFSKKPLVFIVGDSHSKSLPKIQHIVVVHFGPVTLFNITSKPNARKLYTIESLLRPCDIVVFSLGEIDIRYHHDKLNDRVYERMLGNIDYLKRRFRNSFFLTSNIFEFLPNIYDDKNFPSIDKRVLKKKEWNSLLKRSFDDQVISFASILKIQEESLVYYILDSLHYSFNTCHSQKFYDEVVNLSGCK